MQARWSRSAWGTPRLQTPNFPRYSSCVTFLGRCQWWGRRPGGPSPPNSQGTKPGASQKSGFLDQTPVTSRTPAPSQRELRADKFYFMSLIVTSQNIQHVLCDSFVLNCNNNNSIQDNA